MSKPASQIPEGIGTPQQVASMKRRRATERRFRVYGRACVAFSILALSWLLLSVLNTGLSGFNHHWVDLELQAPSNAQSGLTERQSFIDVLSESYPEASDDPQAILPLISDTAAIEAFREQTSASPNALSISVPVSPKSDQFLKGHLNVNEDAFERVLTTTQIKWLEDRRAEGNISRRFNSGLFVNPDSRDAERAGLATAIFGSVMIVLISGLVAIPVGVGAAIYLDSFAPQTGWAGKLTRFLEVNINNLAAVPAIVFGLLGLAIFINLFGLARSIPLVGGLVMALRMFPTIVIASRSALQAVPESLTDSALSLGASRIQAVFNHKVPVAAPAMLTGAIIGMAQALGETAPLLMIGMVAFVTTVPETPLDPATALPVQIFLWSGSADLAWAEIASAAIIILLCVLMLINGVAVIVRERLQRKPRA